MTRRGYNDQLRQRSAAYRVPVRSSSRRRRPDQRFPPRWKAKALPKPLASTITAGEWRVTIEVTDEGVLLNGSALVVTTDIECSNGVIHVIDAVLLPAAPQEFLNLGDSCYTADGAECGPGLTCGFNATITDLVCLVEAQPNSACVLPGIGDCVEGFLCIPDVGAVAGGVCRPIVGLGEACGLGVAGCDDATYCPLVNGVTNATCLPKTEAGGECLTSICADGTDCLWSDASQTTALCYTQERTTRLVEPSGSVRSRSRVHIRRRNVHCSYMSWT